MLIEQQDKIVSLLFQFGIKPNNPQIEQIILALSDKAIFEQMADFPALDDGNFILKELFELGDLNSLSYLKTKYFPYFPNDEFIISPTATAFEDLLNLFQKEILVNFGYNIAPEQYWPYVRDDFSTSYSRFLAYYENIRQSLPPNWNELVAMDIMQEPYRNQERDSLLVDLNLSYHPTARLDNLGLTIRIQQNMLINALHFSLIRKDIPTAYLLMQRIIVNNTTKQYLRVLKHLLEGNEPTLIARSTFKEVINELLTKQSYPWLENKQNTHYLAAANFIKSFLPANYLEDELEEKGEEETKETPVKRSKFR